MNRIVDADVDWDDDGREMDEMSWDQNMFQCQNCGRLTVSMLCGCENAQPERVKLTPEVARIFNVQNQAR